MIVCNQALFKGKTKKRTGWRNVNKIKYIEKHMRKIFTGLEDSMKKYWKESK